MTTEGLPADDPIRSGWWSPIRKREEILEQTVLKTDDPNRPKSWAEEEAENLWKIVKEVLKVSIE